MLAATELGIGSRVVLTTTRGEIEIEAFRMES